MSAIETTQPAGTSTPIPTPVAEPGNGPSSARLSRAERNRRNARRSTGPRTREGKNVSRMNACNHGGTAQTVILPTDDAAAYQKFAADQLTALSPEGADEAAFAQAIIDTRWQLARTQTFENNLIYLLPTPPSHIHVGNESPERQQQLKTAEAAAKTFFENLHKFDLMSRYSARLSRLIIQNHDKLTKIQNARRNADRAGYPTAPHASPCRVSVGISSSHEGTPPSDIDREIMELAQDLFRLPPNIQARMDQARAEARERFAGQQNQQPERTSGFVSQPPNARGEQAPQPRPVAAEQTQNPLSKDLDSNKNRAA